MKSPETRNSLGSSDSAPGRCYFHSPKDLTKWGKSPVKTMRMGGRNLEWGQEHGEGSNMDGGPGLDPGTGRALPGNTSERVEGSRSPLGGAGAWGPVRCAVLGGGTARALQTHGHVTKPMNEYFSSTSRVRRATSKAQTQGSRDLSASQLGATCCPPLDTLGASSSRPGHPPLVLPWAPPSWPRVFAPVPAPVCYAPCCRLPRHLRSLLRHPLLQGLSLPP